MAHFGIRTAGELLALLLCCAAQRSPLSAQRSPGATPAEPISIEYAEIVAHRQDSVKSLRMANPDFFPRDVEVHVVVDTQGNVVSATETNGPKELADYAVQEVRSWKYEPFMRNGKPVEAQFSEDIPVLPNEKKPQVHVAFPAVQDLSKVMISLKRTACYGTCPAYAIQINGDGTEQYDGIGFVAVTGHHTDTISGDSVARLLDEFRAADFFSLDANYHWDATDLPTYTTAITIHGVTKSVIDYGGLEVGMPEAVRDLEKAIDREAKTDKWIKGDAETVGSLAREGTDFKSPASAAIVAHLAAQGNTDEIRALVTAGTPVTGRDERQMTALEYATRSDNTDLVSFLLDAGAGRTDRATLTECLIGAAQSGDLKIVESLIDYGADPKGISHNGTTILMAATGSGVPSVVRRILDYGPDVNEANAGGDTALFRIGEWARPNITRDVDRAAVVRLLVDAGIDVNHQDKAGNTALHETYYSDSARALIQAGAELEIRNNWGNTPLLQTVSKDIAALLVSAGADTTVRDRSGETIFDHARRFAWGDTSFLSSSKPVN